jgi:nitrite reductase/ring-hydroxylating ferredoxin subunit
MKFFSLATLSLLSTTSAFLTPSLPSTNTIARTSGVMSMAGGSGIVMKQKDFAPKMEWVPVIKATEIAPGDIIPVETDGLQLLMIADESGSIYSVANVCPHLGTPLDQGSLGTGTIVCPLHNSAFSLETGELVGDWCPFPPVLGPLVLGKLQPPRDLAVFEVRSKGQNIEVLINKNLKADFEGKYWAGLLDAQGKATGDYY